MVILAVDDFVESFDGVFNVNQHTLQTRKLLGHEERLRQETLHPAGAAYHQFVVFRKLFQTQDGNDILQFLVALQNLLHALSRAVVLVTKNFSAQDTRGRIERVNGGVDTQLGHLPAQYRRGIEVSKRRGGGRVSQVIGRYVNGLYRGDRAALGRGDTFLHGTHFGSQCGLITYRRWHPT